MKKFAAILALGALLVGVVAPPAHAHGGAVLALAAFTAFNLLFLPFALAAAVVAPPVYAPPVVFAPPVVVSSPVAPPVAFAPRDHLELRHHAGVECARLERARGAC